VKRRRGGIEYVLGNADLVIVVLGAKCGEVLIDLLPELGPPVDLEKDLTLKSKMRDDSEAENDIPGARLVRASGA
jgi:hypothetical protein